MTRFPESKAPPHALDAERTRSDIISENIANGNGCGGCIIHTRFGLLDARRETMIEQLRQSLAA